MSHSDDKYQEFLERIYADPTILWTSDPPMLGQLALYMNKNFWLDSYPRTKIPASTTRAKYVEIFEEIADIIDNYLLEHPDVPKLKIREQTVQGMPTLSNHRESNSYKQIILQVPQIVAPLIRIMHGTQSLRNSSAMFLVFMFWLLSRREADNAEDLFAIIEEIYQLYGARPFAEVDHHSFAKTSQILKLHEDNLLAFEKDPEGVQPVYFNWLRDPQIYDMIVTSADVKEQVDRLLELEHEVFLNHETNYIVNAHNLILDEIGEEEDRETLFLNTVLRGAVSDEYYRRDRPTQASSTNVVDLQRRPRRSGLQAAPPTYQFEADEEEGMYD